MIVASPARSTPTYFPRHVHFVENDGKAKSVSEAELIALPGPRIVLGEPGMGKSELMQELGRLLGVKPVSAIRFMLNRHPSKLVVPGKPLLIDALDEAMARREGDAVDTILAQLEEADAPDFVLSCRAREWQSRSIGDLRQLYGVTPLVLTIEPAIIYLANPTLLVDTVPV